MAVRRVHLGLARRLAGGEPRPCCPSPRITGVWGITFVVVLVNAALADAADRREGRGAHRAVLVAIGATIAVLAPGAPAGRGHRRAAVSIAVVQIDVRVPAARLDGGGGPDGCAAQHRGAPNPRRPARRPTSWCGARERSIPRALEDPATVAATQAAIVGRRGADDDRRGRERSGRLAAHERARLRRTRQPGGSVRQGAPRAVRGVRAVSTPADVDRRDRPDPGRPGAGGEPPHDRAAGRSRRTAPRSASRTRSPRSRATFVRDGATFLVVPVNNASYLFTAAAAQHLQMSQMRAVETGRWVVDAGVSGISAFIDPRRRRAEPHRAVPARYPAGPGPGVHRADAVRAVRRLGAGPVTGDARDVRPDSSPTHAGAARCPGRCRRRCGRSRSLPTYDERGHDRSRDPRGARDARGRRARRRRFLARRHRGHRPGDRRGASRGFVCWRDRRNRGCPAPIVEGFQVAIAEGYDVAIEMDSDLSHDPAELPSLLAAAARPATSWSGADTCRAAP